MFLLLFVLKPMFFRWGCKNWHITKLFHPVPMGVNSPGLWSRKSVWCEHQWQCLAAVPTEEQTRLWEIGSSSLCPALLPTHRRLGNTGGKSTSSKLFSSDWCHIQSRGKAWMISSKEKSQFTWQCQESHQLGCPKASNWSRLSWKHLCLYHYSMQTKCYYQNRSFYTLLQHLLKQREVTSSLFSFWQIIRWISENMSTCHSFDPIQEFIIGRYFFSCILNFPAYSSWHWRGGHGSTNWIFWTFWLWFILTNLHFVALRDSISSSEDTQTSQNQIGSKTFQMHSSV